MDESVLACCRLIESSVCAHHVSVNAGKLVLAHDDPELASIVEQADLVNADGQSAVWGARMLGIPVPERVTGIDLMMRLIGEAETRGWPIYLLGATQEVCTLAVKAIESRYPNVTIAGFRNGYFSDDESVAKDVLASGARLLLVGMPSPRKEHFIHEQAERLGSLLAFGVGGSFDILAEKTRRAPKWMQSAGLEWFYRFTQEPRRMWRRYLVGNARFVLLLIRQMIVRSSRPQ